MDEVTGEWFDVCNFLLHFILFLDLWLIFSLI